MFSEKLCQSLFYSLPPFLPHSIPKYLRKLIYLPPDRSSVPPSENSYSTIPPSILPQSLPLHAFLTNSFPISLIVFLLPAFNHPSQGSPTFHPSPTSLTFIHSSYHSFFLSISLTLTVRT